MVTMIRAPREGRTCLAAKKNMLNTLELAAGVPTFFFETEKLFCRSADKCSARADRSTRLGGVTAMWALARALVPPAVIRAGRSRCPPPAFASAMSGGRGRSNFAEAQDLRSDDADLGDVGAGEPGPDEATSEDASTGYLDELLSESRVIKMDRPPAGLSPQKTFKVPISPEAVEELPEDIQYVMDIRTANASAINAARKRAAIARWQRFPGDTGSPEVEVAVLTERVRYLAKHLDEHKKDKHSMRGMTALLNQRKSRLSYLKAKDYDRYMRLVQGLGLRA